MLTYIISSIATSLLTGLALWYSESKINQKQKKEIAGNYVLRVPITYKFLGIICFMIGTFLMIHMIFFWNEDIQILGPMSVSLFIILGTLTTMYYYNYKLIFNEHRIIVYNWTGKQTRLEWKELTKIKSINSLHSIQLTSKKNKILISKELVGFIDFTEMIAQMKKNNTINSVQELM